MKTLGQRLQEQLEDNEVLNEKLDEFASLSKKGTGLDVIVYIYLNLYNTFNKPVIGIQKDASDKMTYDMFYMTISDKPEIIGNSKLLSSQIEKVSQWIKKNKELLLKYWNNRIYTSDVVLNMKRV